MKCPHCNGDMTPMNHGICPECKGYCGCSFSPESLNDYCETHKPKGWAKPEKKKHMGKMIVLIGLPGSGKSTYARKQMEENGNVMRVNRDEIRSMLFKNWKGKKEQVVSEIEKAAIISAVSNQYDIIIDDTNVSPNTRRRWKSLSVELGVAHVEIPIQATIEECIDRDSKRVGRNHVGQAVIENMALKYNLIPKIPPDQKVVIFDIDGTLADCLHRKTYLNVCKTCNETEEFHKDPAINECSEFIPGKKNHKIFYAKVNEDKPIDVVIQWAQRCHYEGYYVLTVSGRPTDLAGDATMEWLRRHGVIYRHLFMRAGGDYRDDTIVKQEILDNILHWIPKEQILFAVDDRPRVIRMWKSNGIRCFDVGEGVEF